MTTALIDGDSIYYILAWQFRDRMERLLTGEISPDEANREMCGAVDQFVIGILQACGATHYLGAIGDKEKCFRYNVAKFKPYKGGRKPPEPWLQLWKPVIEARLREEWGFISVPGLEADDIIAMAWEQFKITEHHDYVGNDPVPTYKVRIETNHTIICTPDKDLRQLPGRFFDYKKLDFADVDQDQADYNFAFQMIAGDSTDGVAGIPGAGEKKAKDKLKEAKEAGQFYDQVVHSMYFKHFGDHYGRIIYNENAAVLGLVTSKHPYYDEYEATFTLLPVPEGVGPGQATLDTLKSLGWG